MEAGKRVGLLETLEHPVMGKLSLHGSALVMGMLNLRGSFT